jgi:hypothetical protein
MTDLAFVGDTLDRKALLGALRSLRKGDFGVRLPHDLTGIDGEIAQAFNDVVDMNETVADEFARIRDEVGKEAGSRNACASPPRRAPGANPSNPSTR